MTRPQVQIHGRVGNNNFPTFLDGIAWIPTWGDPSQYSGTDTSSRLPLKLGDNRFDCEVIACAGDDHTKNPLAITGIDKRDPVTCESGTGDQLANFPDSQPGCHWYKVRFFIRNPHG